MINWHFAWLFYYLGSFHSILMYDIHRERTGKGLHESWHGLRWSRVNQQRSLLGLHGSWLGKQRTVGLFVLLVWSAETPVLPSPGHPVSHEKKKVQLPWCSFGVMWRVWGSGTSPAFFFFCSIDLEWGR